VAGTGKAIGGTFTAGTTILDYGPSPPLKTKAQRKESRYGAPRKTLRGRRGVPENNLSGDAACGKEGENGKLRGGRELAGNFQIQHRNLVVSKSLDSRPRGVRVPSQLIFFLEEILQGGHLGGSGSGEPRPKLSGPVRFFAVRLRHELILKSKRGRCWSRRVRALPFAIGRDVSGEGTAGGGGKRASKKSICQSPQKGISFPTAASLRGVFPR